MTRNQRLRSAIIATAGALASIHALCDPLPESSPLECEDVAEGQSLAVEPTLAGTSLTARITHADHNATWEEDSVAIVKPINVVSEASPSIGGALVSVSVQLTSATVTSGGFTFSGRLKQGSDTSCTVTRDLSFTIDGANVTLE